jgi:hypothetical protein
VFIQPVGNGNAALKNSAQDSNATKSNSRKSESRFSKYSGTLKLISRNSSTPVPEL